MRTCSLCDLLKDKKDLVGAEIGVWQGENARGLVEHLDIKTLYLVDPYVPYIDSTQGTGLLQRDYEEQKKTAEEALLGYPVVWMVETSLSASAKIDDNSLDFVYIDAAHQYANVIEDIRRWFPKVRKGGILAGHDLSIDGVRQAVEEFTAEKGLDYSSAQGDWFILL